MTTGDKFELTYFKVRARAEVSRLLFELAGVEYENKFVTQEVKNEISSNTSRIPFTNRDTFISGMESPETRNTLRAYSRPPRHTFGRNYV